MSDSGRLFDTYVAARQHDLVDLPDVTLVVGVVRHPTRWLHREHLDESDDARDALDRLQGLLRDGRDVALVCYENTDEKRCHSRPVTFRMQVDPNGPCSPASRRMK